MARVTLIDDTTRPELSELVARIRGRRGGRLLNIYRVLLHSPGLAAAWLEFNSAVRFLSELDDRVRELAIMRVAIVNGANYVLDVHASRHAGPAGITPAEVEALAAWRESRCFSARERALLAYVDAMTGEVRVPDGVYSGVREHFSERQAVELTVLVGAYAMNTRVLEALKVDPEPRAEKDD